MITKITGGGFGKLRSYCIEGDACETLKRPVNPPYMDPVNITKYIKKINNAISEINDKILSDENYFMVHTLSFDFRIASAATERERLCILQYIVDSFLDAGWDCLASISISSLMISIGDSRRIRNLENGKTKFLNMIDNDNVWATFGLLKEDGSNDYEFDVKANTCLRGSYECISKSIIPETMIKSSRQYMSSEDIG